MTVFQRAATLAAMTFALVGLGAVSTPGEAAGLQAAQAVAQAAPQVAPLPIPAVLLVPALDPDTQVTAPAVPPPTEQASSGPAAAFASLDDAVAAQDGAGIDESTRCLAGAIYFESKGEPVDGQLAVAEVIINRAKSGRFPADVCGVVKQHGQFSFVRGGEIPAIDADRTGYRTAVAVAKVALAKAWESSAPKALFFHARRAAIGGRLTRVAAIGNHVFYR